MSKFKLPKLKRIYIGLVSLFFIHLFFFDTNSITTRIKYRMEIQELKKDIKKYDQEYKEADQLLKELKADPNKIDKVAREKYFMCTEDEVVYIFED